MSSHIIKYSNHKMSIHINIKPKNITYWKDAKSGSYKGEGEGLKKRKEKKSEGIRQCKMM